MDSTKQPLQLICEFNKVPGDGFYPWVGKMPWRRAWQPTPVFLRGESHGQRKEPGELQFTGLQRVGHN